MAGTPAWLYNGRLDFAAGNSLGPALDAPMTATAAAQPVNNARFTFLDPWTIGWPNHDGCASFLPSHSGHQAHGAQRSTTARGTPVTSDEAGRFLTLDAAEEPGSGLQRFQ